MNPTFLPTTTHAKTVGILRATLAIIALVGLALTSFLFGKEPASVAPLFDHSQCQYPERASNPVDGCDNSDLVDPSDSAVIKGEVPTNTTQELQKPVSHNIETVEKPVESVDNSEPPTIWIDDGILRDKGGNPIPGK